MANKMLSYETLVHALAGVGVKCSLVEITYILIPSFQGNCIAMTLVLPLDTIRHRLVMDKNIRSKTLIGTFKELIGQEGV